MKHLKIEVLTTAWGKILRIVEQTHRGKEFGRDGQESFTASNGFLLQSYCFPEGGGAGESLLVRGSSVKEDMKIVVVRSDEWLERCCEALREYNRIFFEEVPKVEIEVIE